MDQGGNRDPWEIAVLEGEHSLFRVPAMLKDEIQAWVVFGSSRDWKEKTKRVIGFCWE